MDFEEEMELFSIRKGDEAPSEIETEHNRNSKHVNYSKEMFNCIPLMCKHITSLKENWNDENWITIFSGVKFKHCLLYGKIMCKEKEYKSGFTYILDDGTASLKINIFRKIRMEIIWEMENELQATKREMLAQNKIEIGDSLRNLLFKTKEQAGNDELAIGSKILVYGKPTYHRGQTTFNVDCFIKDGKSNRDIEIYFKDYLIHWYRNNCTFSKN